MYTETQKRQLDLAMKRLLLIFKKAVSEWTCGHMGVREGGTNWEIGVDVCALPCVKLTASGEVLYNTSSSAWCSVITQRSGMAGWKGGLRGRGHVYQFSSVQSLSRVRLFETPWIAAHQTSLSITNSRSSLRLMSIESVMPSSHFILCHPLLLLLPIRPSIRVFSNESTLRMRWPKYWSFSFSSIPSKEHPGLISFRMDWLDLLAVQGTLKSLLQHYTSKASILWH